MKIKTLAATVLAVSGLLCATTAQALLISWNNLVNSSVGLGNTFNVELVFSGLSNASNDSVAGYDIDVKYDPAILKFSGSSFGTVNQLDFVEAGSFPFYGVTDDLGGVIDVAALSGNSQSVLDTNQDNSFVGLILTFQAINLSSATRIELDLEDPFLLILGSNGDVLDATYNPNFLTLQVQTEGTALPEPSTIYLVGLVLLGALALKYRRSESKELKK
jgi:hypothetical protein